MLSNRQKDLVKRQKESEEGEIGGALHEVRVKEGDRITFLEEAQAHLSGVVYRITNDQWKMICIDYGIPGRAKIISPDQFRTLLRTGKIKHDSVKSEAEKKIEEKLEAIAKEAFKE